MQAVFKYKIAARPDQSVQIPAGASLLTAQFQGEDLVVWALVDPDARPEPRLVHVVGTGDPFEAAGARYLATVQKPRTPFVYHVFSD